MEQKSGRTSQNIRGEVLKEIGELSCIFYLYYHFNDKGWSVYKNYDEKGYDILLVKEGEKKRKIEVKSRQRLINSASNKNTNTYFTLSEIEKKEADFLVAFWIEHNMFFIVPTNAKELEKHTSKNKHTYVFKVKLNEKLGSLNETANKYLDSWGMIVQNIK